MVNKPFQNALNFCNEIEIKPIKSRIIILLTSLDFDFISFKKHAGFCMWFCFLAFEGNSFTSSYLEKAENVQSLITTLCIIIWDSL